MKKLGIILLSLTTLSIQSKAASNQVDNRARYAKCMVEYTHLDNQEKRLTTAEKEELLKLTSLKEQLKQRILNDKSSVIENLTGINIYGVDENLLALAAGVAVAVDYSNMADEFKKVDSLKQAQKVARHNLMGMNFDKAGANLAAIDKARFSTIPPQVLQNEADAKIKKQKSKLKNITRALKRAETGPTRFLRNTAILVGLLQVIDYMVYDAEQVEDEVLPQDLVRVQKHLGDAAAIDKEIKRLDLDIARVMSHANDFMAYARDDSTYNKVMLCYSSDLQNTISKAANMGIAVAEGMYTQDASAAKASINASTQYYSAPYDYDVDTSNKQGEL